MTKDAEQALTVCFALVLPVFHSGTPDPTGSRESLAQGRLALYESECLDKPDE